MSAMVATTPSRSQRRPEVATRSRRHAGRETRLSALENAMSSISAMSGKPPARSNASRRTKIAWSPVAMPVTRERRFMLHATSARSGERPSIATSKRPHARSFASARSIASNAPSGSRVSAWRKRRIAPRLARAPAFICDARPRGACSTRSHSGAAISRVASRLAPSTTSSSAPRARSGANAASVAAIACDSSSAGTMIESGAMARL
jgi:hypothetical protein